MWNMPKWCLAHGIEEPSEYVLWKISLSQVSSSDNQTAKKSLNVYGIEDPTIT